MTIENKRSLLKQVIEILNSTDCLLHRELYSQCVNLVSSLVPDLSLEFINSTLLDTITSLTKPRSPIAYRHFGFTLLEGVVIAKTIMFWEEPICKQLVFTMVKDPDWRIRR